MTLPTRTILLAALLAGTASAAALAAPSGDRASLGSVTDRGHVRPDVNGDGAIDRAEAAAHPRLASRFDRLDRDGDGRLQASERRHDRGRSGHRGDAVMRAARLDGNGDGRISRIEAAAHPRTAERFDSVDRNRDGYLVRSELQAAVATQRRERAVRWQQRLQQQFAAADGNRDGRLSRAEVETSHPRLAARFAFMDEDRDGFLVPRDLQPSRR